MPKLRRKAGALLAVLVLAVFAALPTAAAPKEEPKAELTLRSSEDFLAFATNCREDAYSKDLTVRLETDIDLTGLDFEGIPIFSGTFLGQGHTIQGLSLTGEGSVVGLFRYLPQSARVADLTVAGDVKPGGTRCQVGGIAGVNAGKLERCRFYGTVEGDSNIGGLVGENRVTGILEECSVSGTLQGVHFVGGIAGDNRGTLRACVSRADVNTVASDNPIKISEITTASILNTESSSTVTDIGGIAGTSSGVIRTCRSHGTVGYPHMGYNVGGIAGSQQGLIADSINYGTVYGRKEVAGIVGQMEPAAKVEYTADTLQILRRQLDRTSALANQASANAHSSASALSDQMGQLQGHADSAADAVRALLPDHNEDGVDFPDEDQVLAAKNSLNASVSSMQGTLSSIVSSTQSGADTLAHDIQAVTDQISTISNTLHHATDNIGFSITDVSDKDTENDLSGKVVDCRNEGTIEGDLNVGGIAGILAVENSADPEDDLQMEGNRSLNVNSELRAVLLRCENRGDVAAKKRSAGGIAGKAWLGLVKDCQNAGTVGSEDADQVGGVLGTSRATIRGCAAKCRILGDTRLGGIAGSGSFAQGCRSAVFIEDGTEKLGAVMGEFTADVLEPEDALSENYYLSIGREVGGIDGVGYQDHAQPLSLGDFQALDALPDLFRSAHITFKNGDTVLGQVQVPLGEMLAESQIPKLPQKDGFTSKWEDSEYLFGQPIYLDMTIYAEQTADRTVIESLQRREDGRAVLLAEGQFSRLNQFPVQELTEGLPELASNETLIEGWQLSDTAPDRIDRLRLAVPEGEKANLLHLYTQDASGIWTLCSFEESGHYLVLPADIHALALARIPDLRPLFITVGCAAGAVLVLLLLVFRRIRRKKRTAAAVPSSSV